MKENGMDIYAISKLVVTSVKVLTETYAHIFDDFVEKEIEKSKEIRKDSDLDLFNRKDTSNKIIPFSKYQAKWFRFCMQLKKFLYAICMQFFDKAMKNNDK